jgi:hypothetical protein
LGCLVAVVFLFGGLVLWRRGCLVAEARGAEVKSSSKKGTEALLGKWVWVHGLNTIIFQENRERRAHAQDHRSTQLDIT